MDETTIFIVEDGHELYIKNTIKSILEELIAIEQNGNLECDEICIETE